MDEYIDRQTAIDFIDAGHFVNPNEPRWSDNEVVNFLQSRPSADVQPVIHARWEIGTGFRWRCSKCGGLTYIPSKFCFNCGARMDEGSEQ